MEKVAFSFRVDEMTPNKQFRDILEFPSQLNALIMINKYFLINLEYNQVFVICEREENTYFLNNLLETVWEK